MGSREMVLMNLFVVWEQRHRERTSDTADEGEDRMNCETSIEICTLPYVKQIDNGSAV